MCGLIQGSVWYWENFLKQRGVKLNLPIGKYNILAMQVFQLNFEVELQRKKSMKTHFLLYFYVICTKLKLINNFV